jgi:hypothetical protein
MRQIIKCSTWLVAVASAIAFPSCKKDKDDNNGAKTNMELITTGSWKLTAYTINPALDPNGQTNLYTNWPSCRKDDQHTFKTNGVVEINHGPTKCSPSDAQVINWAWNFTNSDETKMMYDGNEYTIEELTNTTLRIKNLIFNVSTAKFHARELTYMH